MYRPMIKTPRTTRMFGAFLLSLMTLIGLVPVGFVAAFEAEGATSYATKAGSQHSITATDHGQAAFNASTTSSALMPTVLPALNFTVNNTADNPDVVLDGVCADLNGKCTLRAAIQETNNVPSADTIGFSLPANSTITLTSALDDINGDLTITGPAGGVTVSGANQYRVFNVLGGRTVNISNLTIANGGGIKNSGVLTVTNSTISGNDNIYGGGFFNLGTLTVTNTTISGNIAHTGGGFYNDFHGTLTVTNSTVTNNRSRYNDPVYGFYGGGGIFGGTGTINLRNTIVAGNFLGESPSTTPNDIFNPINPTSSFNLIGTGGSGGLTNGVNQNQVGVADAGLGPLANNGGPTQTHRLLTGSPAIDKGKNFATDANNNPILTDQRGLLRPVDLATYSNATGGDASDIGAYELQGDTVQSGPSFIVNTPDDHDDGECTNGDCTLREAIIAANSDFDASTITFDLPGAGPHIIQLTAPLDDLDTDMNIQGPTDESVQVRGESFDDPYSIFTVSVAEVSISKLTISNGAEFGFFGGGGILNGGFLTINDSKFTDNLAEFGGAIDNETILTINNNNV